MAMVITCDSCRSRFHLNKALLKDAKGARIRCRKCGRTIIVRNPEVPPILPASTAAPKTSRVPVEDQEKRGSPTPKKRLAPRADRSDKIRPEPAPSLPVGHAASSTESPAPIPPEKPERKGLRLEELFHPPSPADAAPNPFGNVTSREIGTPRPLSMPPSSRLPHGRVLLLVAGLSVLLLAGGLLYFGVPRLHHPLLGNAAPGKGGDVTGKTRFDIRDVKWYRNRQPTGESLYVIKGNVVNVGKGNSSGILIQAALLDNNNQTIGKSEVFAGNMIDETLLPHMSRIRIEGFLGMRYGEGNANRDIPAGKSLPFMVVFFDPPGGGESITVRATDAEETGKILPPDGNETEKRDFNKHTIRLN